MLAILSDIHANREALEAVLADAAQFGAVRFVSLGDVIGFNGDPAACVERVAALPLLAVRGNHEQALLRRGLFGVPLFTRMMDLTGKMLPDSARKAMEDLPYLAEEQGITFVHASPYEPEHWTRLGSAADAALAFSAFAGRICFFGHTHRTALWYEDQGRVGSLPVQSNAEGLLRISLDPARRYLINPGSVGQPRDRDPRAAYALFDAGKQELLLRRVAYDVETACSKISRTELPESFAEALRRGSNPF